jgi:hypothetical protein
VSLNDWRKNGWLKEHQPSGQEIADLLGVADRDLEASCTPELINDWRFNISYNAALQVASAALAASGFHAERANHHYRVTHSLEFTVGVDARTIRTFSTFRKKRNITDYERAHTISDREAEEMLNLARRLRKDVAAWIADKHPGLIS